jgi:hypothetical protein
LKASIIAFTLLAATFGLLVFGPSASAQTSSGSMSKVTSGGSLHVTLQPSPSPIKKGGQTNFKVSFDQKTGGAVQPHIDYDVAIVKTGKQVFQASALAGHPNQPLHTAEGVVTIPYTFQSPGRYAVNVTVYGILFNPIKPETAQFPITVS